MASLHHGATVSTIASATRAPARIAACRESSSYRIRNRSLGERREDLLRPPGATGPEAAGEHRRNGERADPVGAAREVAHGESHPGHRTIESCAPLRLVMIGRRQDLLSDGSGITNALLAETRLLGFHPLQILLQQGDPLRQPPLLGDEARDDEGEAEEDEHQEHQ